MPRAARLAGVNARMILYSAYLISGVCAAAAGVILTADTHTSDPVSEGLYIELDAILAVVIGGGSLSGGGSISEARCSAPWSFRH